MIKTGDKKIILREFRITDRDQLKLLADNREIWKNLRDSFPSPYTVQDADFFINSRVKDNPATHFAIEYKGDFCGAIGFVIQPDIYRKSAELGYWLGKPFWNKGIATEAVKAIVNYIFTVTDLVRIYSGVFEYNPSSRRVLEKAGFKLEGIFRKAVFKNNSFTDEYKYAILRNNI